MLALQNELHIYVLHKMQLKQHFYGLLVFLQQLKVSPCIVDYQVLQQKQKRHLNLHVNTNGLNSFYTPDLYRFSDHFVNIFFVSFKNCCNCNLAWLFTTAIRKCHFFWRITRNFEKY